MDVNTLSALLQRYATEPDAPLTEAEAATVAEATRLFPYSAVPMIMALRSGTLTPEQRSEMQMRVALLCSDRRTLDFAQQGTEWAGFYPPEPEAQPMQTEDVIDTFLRTYGSCTPREEALLERMIFNPTPDYAEMLAREEQVNMPDPADDGEPDSPQARINAFIRNQHPAAPVEPQPIEIPDAPEEEEEARTPIPRPSHSDDSLLSESLAKIFIKQGRYERAYEIISGINLKFPKKSAYFADQLRFLQKLIINQRRLKENQAGSEQ